MKLSIKIPRSCLLFLSSILFSCTLLGQEVLVSEKLSMRGDEGYQLLGKIADQYMLLRLRSESYEMVAYDEELKEKYTKELVLESKKAMVLAIVTDDQNFTLIYRYTKRSNIHLCAVKYDREAEMIDSTTIRIFDTRGFVNIDEEIIASQNERYLLIYDSDLFDRFYGIAFDIVEMKVIWTKNFLPQDIDLEKDHLSAVIDDQANAHIVFEKDNKRQKKESTRFELLYFDHAADMSIRYAIPLSNHLWTDVDFRFDNLNNRLVVAGLYSNSRTDEADGIFFIKINPQATDAYSIHFEPLDEKFMINLLGKELKKEESLEEISVRDIVLRRDGGALLITERNKKFTRRVAGYSSYYNDRLVDYQIDFHFDDIVLFSINPDGSLHWKEILRKRQYSQDDEGIYSSYFLLKTRSNLRFLYNDQIDFDTNVNEYVLDGKGNYERNSVLYTDKENLSLVFRDAQQIGASSLLVPSLRKNDLKLVKIIF